MNFIKKALVFVLLFLLVGCSTKLTEENQEQVDADNKISLNVYQSDLIASITDNEKYLNKDLLYSIDMLEDDDEEDLAVDISNDIIDGLYSLSAIEQMGLYPQRVIDRIKYLAE